MRGWITDFVFALRLLRKSPGFTLLAVLCLGLGIGVNQAIFSLLNYLFLKPLAVAEPDRLVVLSRGGGPLFSWADYRDFRDRNQSMTGMAASNPTESSLDFDGESHAAAAEAVSLNYADVIGFRPFLGRWFVSENEPAVVLSYATWRRLFHGDPNVLGKRVRSETQWYTVVGVAPREFTGIYMPMSMDLWVPFQMAAFGTLALLLAAVGLYGVLAYHVTLRTREFGIRMAIGAQRQDVFRLVFRQGVKLTVIGVALGLAFSVGLARLLANLLYGVSPTDTATYVLTASLWLAVAAAACYFPARRATRVEPLVALRHE